MKPVNADQLSNEREHRTIREELDRRTYRWTSEFYDGFLAGDEPPYPIVGSDAGWELHFIPMTDAIHVHLVESDSSLVHHARQHDPAQLFSPKGLTEILHSVEVWTLKRDTPIEPETKMELLRRSEERFSDPFDRELCQQLRWPIADWFDERTEHIVTSEHSHRPETAWEITIAAPDGQQSGMAVEYTTDDIAARNAKYLFREYQGKFRVKLPPPSATWRQWYEIGWRWFGSDVEVEGFAESDIPEIDPDEAQYVRSSSGKVHLVANGADSGLCGSPLAETESGPEFSPQWRPATGSICHGCSEWIKTLRAAATLEVAAR